MRKFATSYHSGIGLIWYIDAFPWTGNDDWIIRCGTRKIQQCISFTTHHKESKTDHARVDVCQIDAGRTVHAESLAIDTEMYRQETERIRVLYAIRKVDAHAVQRTGQRSKAK